MSDIVRVRKWLEMNKERSSDPDFVVMAKKYRELQSREQQQPEQQKASTSDMIRGNTGMRFLAGAAAPLVGSFQLGVNAGDLAIDAGRSLVNNLTGVTADREAMGLSSMPERTRASDMVNSDIREDQASAARGQEALGRGTLDLAGMAGAGLAGFGMVPAKIATTAMGKVGQAMGYGAGGAASLPVANEDFWKTKGIQTGVGALTGVATQGGVELLRKPVATLSHMLSAATAKPRNMAGLIMLEAIGGVKNAERYAQRLERAPKGLTVGQAQLKKNRDGVYTGSRKLAGLQRYSEQVGDPDFEDIYRMQNEAAYRELGKMGNPERITRLEALRNEATAPMREGALKNANYTTKKAAELIKGVDEGTPKVGDSVQDVWKLKTEQVQAIERARRDSIPGVGKIPFRYSKHQDLIQTIEPFIDDAKTIEALRKSSLSTKQYQLDSMASKGIRENPIIVKIRELHKTPEVRGNPRISEILDDLLTKMDRMADPDGTFDAQVLYEFRKSGLDDMIESYATKDSNTSANLVNKLTPLKRSIDDAIEEAAGGGWKDYLNLYSKISREVDVAKVVDGIRQSLKPPLAELGASPSANAAKMAEKLRNPEETIASITKFGAGPKSFEALLGPERAGRLNKVVDSVARNDEAQRMGERGLSSASARLGDVGTGRFPNALIREVMIANGVLSRLGSKLLAETLDEFVKLMRNKDLAARVLREASKEERKAIERAMLRGVIANTLKSGGIASASEAIGTQ